MTDATYQEPWQQRTPDRPVPRLADFLLARIAEDEHAVSESEHTSSPSPYRDVEFVPTGRFDIEWADQAADRFRARVLAECEAKRRIVKLCADIEGKSVEGNWWSLTEHERILAALALPYVDHPDFRPEWREVVA
jgi:hypothetical protein